MARSVQIEEDSSSSSDSDTHTAAAAAAAAAASRTSRARKNPTVSSPSDKENVPVLRTKSKGKETVAAASAPSSNRRNGHQGLREADVNNGDADEDDGEGEAEVVMEEDKDHYDPDQDPEERRVGKKAYRDLYRKLQDSKQEYLRQDSDGLLNTFISAEKLFKNVKQTSDAALDSRLLVSASDLTLKKATNLAFGNIGVGIDVDEFLGKCIAFMRNNSDRRRRRRRQANNDDDDDDESPVEQADDDAMDWEHLGNEVAFQSNKRPATTDFLLGPLSLTKRLRILKPRRQGLGRRRAEDAVRPEEIQGEELEKAEKNNTSKLVQGLYKILQKYLLENNCEEEGVNLLVFVVNPHSFGQTVENIFYLSFLVKEGLVSIKEVDGIPRLIATEPPTAQDHQDFDITRSQIIFPITMWYWKQAIEVFDITETIIPTRDVQELTVGGRTWRN